jgi:hypothetical protein
MAFFDGELESPDTSIDVGLAQATHVRGAALDLGA